MGDAVDLPSTATRLYSIRAYVEDAFAGNPIRDREQPDSTANGFFVDTEASFPTSGDVEVWELFTAGTGTLTVAIVRKVSASSLHRGLHH